MDDKTKAAKHRQIAFLLEDLGHTTKAREHRVDADRLDPPDPFAGLDDEQWVEVESPCSGKHYVNRVGSVQRFKEEGWNYALIRVIPDGDARTHLCIPTGDAAACFSADWATGVQRSRELLGKALDEHEKRWLK